MISEERSDHHRENETITRIRLIFLAKRKDGHLLGLDYSFVLYHDYY